MTDKGQEDLHKAEEALGKAKQDLQEAETSLHEAMKEFPPAQAAPAVPEQPAAQPVAQPPPQPATSAPEQPAAQPPPPAAAPPPPAAAPAQPEAAPEQAPAQAAAPAPAGGSGKWRVEYDRDSCIGAGACVAANADYWSIDQDGKATLKSATFDQGKNVWVLELEDEAQLQKQRDAAGVCPVNVIHIISPEGNKEI